MSGYGAALCPGSLLRAPIPPKDHSSILLVEKRHSTCSTAPWLSLTKAACARTFRSATSPASCQSPALASATRWSPWRRAGTLVAGVGEAVVRLHAAGQPFGRSDPLLSQSAPRLDESWAVWTMARGPYSPSCPMWRTRLQRANRGGQSPDGGAMRGAWRRRARSQTGALDGRRLQTRNDGRWTAFLSPRE